MHWFWRAAFAVGVIFGSLWVVAAVRPVANAIKDAVWYLTVSRMNWARAFMGTYGIVFGVSVAIITLAAYALATRLFGAKPHDGETRCRKCDYILRGITEPRCPECGERI